MCTAVQNDISCLYLELLNQIGYYQEVKIQMIEYTSIQLSRSFTDNSYFIAGVRSLGHIKGSKGMEFKVGEIYQCTCFIVMKSMFYDTAPQKKASACLTKVSTMLREV